jgi:hypothetical protein
MMSSLIEQVEIILIILVFVLVAFKLYRLYRRFRPARIGPPRSRKKPNNAFSFDSGAHGEAARAKNEEGLEIKLWTVDEILKES